MKKTIFAVAALLVSCGGSKSKGGGENPPNPPIVVPPADEIETCLKERTNLTSDLGALEAKMDNLKNAKDLAHGILRASCTKAQ